MAKGSFTKDFAIAKNAPAFPVGVNAFVKLDLYGLKFFYTNILKKTWEDIPLIKPPKTIRIPDIVTIKQANQLFAATGILSYKVFFFTIYKLGLRLGEGIKLKVGDIDTDHMRVHIRDAKGNKDRFVPLPDKTLDTLRNFWRIHKHPSFLFPNRKRRLKNAHLTLVAQNNSCHTINKIINGFDIGWGGVK